MKLKRLSLLIFGNVALCGALACAFIVPTSAAAGTVYRCTGANGQLAFTNKPGGYSGCKKVADYSDAPAKTAAAAATTKHAEYRSEPAAESASAQSATAETGDAIAPAPATSGKDVEVR